MHTHTYTHTHTHRWAEVVRDRAAETSTTSSKQLWDIIIEADERKEEEKYIMQSDRSALAKLLLVIKRILQKATYNLVENPQFGLFVAAVIMFSVVLLQVRTYMHACILTYIQMLLLLQV